MVTAPVHWFLTWITIFSEIYLSAWIWHSAMTLWWWSLTPMNVSLFNLHKNSFIHKLSQKTPLSSWEASILNPASFKFWFNFDGLLSHHWTFYSRETYFRILVKKDSDMFISFPPPSVIWEPKSGVQETICYLMTHLTGFVGILMVFLLLVDIYCHFLLISFAYNQMDKTGTRHVSNLFGIILCFAIFLW